MKSVVLAKMLSPLEKEKINDEVRKLQDILRLVLQTTDIMELNQFRTFTECYDFIGNYTRLSELIIEFQEGEQRVKALFQKPE